MISFLLVALGGAIGSSLRYSVSLIVMRHFSEEVWPLATFAVNIAGGLAMGLVFGWLSTFTTESSNIRLFLATGMLGGFTTFSAFSLEMYQMAARGLASLAFMYGAFSVLLSLLALLLGIYLSRAVFQ